jgi:hypothetical protein
MKIQNLIFNPSQTLPIHITTLTSNIIWGRAISFMNTFHPGLKPGATDMQPRWGWIYNTG